jgi:membrane-bound lytic murein transglycosylase D
VKPGDSLWKIARKYRGVTEEELKRWNNIGDDIRPGQKLKIRQKKK